MIFHFRDVRMNPPGRISQCSAPDSAKQLPKERKEEKDEGGGQLRHFSIKATAAL